MISRGNWGEIDEKCAKIYIHAQKTSFYLNALIFAHSVEQMVYRWSAIAVGVR